MATFEVGQVIHTTTPFLSVSGGLPEGECVFRLEVIDSAGNISLPAHRSVIIYVRESKFPTLEQM